jgi:hypothetical protein
VPLPVLVPHLILETTLLFFKASNKLTSHPEG